MEKEIVSEKFMLQNNRIKCLSCKNKSEDIEIHIDGTTKTAMKYKAVYTSGNKLEAIFRPTYISINEYMDIENIMLSCKCGSNSHIYIKDQTKDSTLYDFITKNKSIAEQQYIIR